MRLLLSSVGAPLRITAVAGKAVRENVQGRKPRYKTLYI